MALDFFASTECPINICTVSLPHNLLSNYDIVTLQKSSIKAMAITLCCRLNSTMLLRWLHASDAFGYAAAGVAHMNPRSTFFRDLSIRQNLPPRLEPFFLPPSPILEFLVLDQGGKLC